MPQRQRLVLLAFGLVVLALVASPASAAGGDPWEAEEQDGTMCQDMTGNWVMCGSSGTGTATPGGLTSCTSSLECMKCGKSTTTLLPDCFRVPENGYCECKTNYTEAGYTCSARGACTYKP